MVGHYLELSQLCGRVEEILVEALLHRILVSCDTLALLVLFEGHAKLVDQAPDGGVDLAERVTTRNDGIGGELEEHGLF